MKRRALLLAATGAGIAGISGCAFDAHTDHIGSNAPRVKSLESAPQVSQAQAAWALVLGSGGPRGFVHIGVLQALEEMELKPPMIVGASVGALVGALWAAGMKATELRKLALSISPMQVLRISFGTDERFSGAAIANFVNSQIGDRPLQSLPIRFLPVAAHAKKRSAVVFDAGDTGIAVQASCAIEGRFTPVWIRGEPYVDPDYVAPVPVRVAKACGAVKVLAIDASAHEDQAPAGTERYRDGDLKKRAAIAPDTKVANFTVHPKFGYYVNITEEFRVRAMDAGYKETIAAAAKIKAALET